MAHELHIYLKNKPAATEMHSTLKLLGFRFIADHLEKNVVEPPYTEWEWKQKNLSVSGFKLLYFDGMFMDSIHADEHRTFLAVEGGLDSSPIDLSMIDITAFILLRRYGGLLHNPARIDRKFPNVYLCGKNTGKT